MAEESKKRHRRTTEERLADLERKRLEILEKNTALLERIEAEKKKLTNRPAVQKEQKERQKHMQWALSRMAPDWDERHLLAAVEKCLGEDLEQLAARGEKILEEHGKPRRGRRPKSAL